MNITQHIQGEVEEFVIDIVGTTMICEDGEEQDELAGRLRHSLTNVARHILEEQVKMVEGLKKNVEILSSGQRGIKDGHVDFRAVTYNQALDTIKQSLQKQIAALDV